MRRIIVDVDVGSDDYLAILVLLHAEKLGLVKLEAITCTSGNTSINNVIKNTVRLLEVVDRTDIPIFEGAHEPLLKSESGSLGYFHGKDGFGDLSHENDPDISIVRNEHAAIGIVNLVTQNPDEISLMCLGPLTNIALAIKLNKHFGKCVKDIWIMGGNYLGNGEYLLEKPVEFNFAYDPPAAHIVLDSIPKSIYILPWETTIKLPISFDWRYNILGDKTSALRLLSEAEKTMYLNNEYWQPCDAFVAFAFIDPEKYILKSRSFSAKIITDDSKYNGLLSIDHNGNRKNIVIIENLHKELFKDFLLELASIS